MSKLHIVQTSFCELLLEEDEWLMHILCDGLSQLQYFVKQDLKLKIVVHLLEDQMR